MASLKQLTGPDAAFLNIESPVQVGHVAGLLIFDRPDDPGYDPYAEWRAQLESRLHLLPPLRRRLVEVPFGIDRPYWADDPDFDLGYHVRHAAIPPPGGDGQLTAVVSRIVARPLDRARPLWLSYVIEGLDGDRFAVLTIVHHATVDGASGAELLTIMLDDSEGATPPSPSPPRTTAPAGAEQLPGQAEMLARGVGGLAKLPLRGAKLTGQLAADATRAIRDPEKRAPMPRLRAPWTPFNDAISADRRLAIRSASLTDVKAIKSAFGVTLNDVVMALCAAGLRGWLEQHHAPTAEPLIALVPISIRTGEEADRWTNRVSMLNVSLPTDEPDPLERVQAAHLAMNDGKRLFEAIPAERLTDFTEFPPPAVFARAMRVGARVGMSAGPAQFNLAISNVPGPRQPLYAAGARLRHYYPVSFILDRQGLNITVHSYGDNLDFGVVCCPDLVADPELVLDGIVAEIATLKELARR